MDWLSLTIGYVAGVYSLGFVAVLWACPEPFPDRLLIAVAWPIAVARVALLDL